MNNQIILNKFSERLFKLIKENNTDINMLAKILGIKSKSTIYRYMNGEMSPRRNLLYSFFFFYIFS